MGKLVGKLIRAAREQAHLSQADLALKMQLKSAQSISNIERGVAPLPRNMLAMICPLLKLDATLVIEALVEEARQKYLAIFETASEGRTQDNSST